MAGSPSDRVLRQVRRLFNIGAVGTMSDAELFDRFVSRRDEAAEAAFEELVIRERQPKYRSRGRVHATQTREPTRTAQRACERTGPSTTASKHPLILARGPDSLAHSVTAHLKSWTARPLSPQEVPSKRRAAGPGWKGTNRSGSFASMGQRTSASAPRSTLGRKIRQDQLEFHQRRAEVLDDLGSDHVGVFEVGRVLQAVVLEPEDVEADLIALE